MSALPRASALRPAALLDAEAAFIGAVMHLPAPAATTALGLVPGEDFADPRLAIVADVCRDLAARGTAPDPTAVLAHVQANAVVTGADAVRSLSLLLADLYGTVPTPASVGWYRVAVLDGALRRRCRMFATRVAQAAEGETIESLLALIGAEVAGVLAVQQRRVASGSVDR